MYDVTRRETFENLNQWLQEVEVYSPGGGKDVVKQLAVKISVSSIFTIHSFE